MAGPCGFTDSANGPRQGCLSFHAIDERRRFVEDLASCAGLFSAAGNQLLGEALYFRKPVFAIPEGMHHEQQINAHFLRQMGAGDWTTVESFRADQLAGFLGRLDEYRDNLSGLAGSMNGSRFDARSPRSTRHSPDAPSFAGNGSLHSQTMPRSLT